MSHGAVVRKAFSAFVQRLSGLRDSRKRRNLFRWEVHVVFVRHGDAHIPVVLYVYHGKAGPVFLAHTVPKTLEEVRPHLERAEEMLGAHVYPKFFTETGYAPDVPWGEAARKAFTFLLRASVSRYGVDLKDVDAATYAALLHFASRETVREPSGGAEQIVGPLRMQGKHADLVFPNVHVFDGKFRPPASEELRIVHPEKPIVLVWAPRLRDLSPKGLERYMKSGMRVRPVEPVPGR